MNRRLASLIISLGLMLSTGGIGYCSQLTFPVTIETHLTFGGSPKEQTSITLAGLGDGEGELLTLVWRKDNSWFSQWWLTVEGDASFSQVGTSALTSLQLASHTPQIGHQYQTVISYCPVQHQVDISVYDLTRGEYLYRGHIAVPAYSSQVVPRVSDSSVQLTKSTQVYVPVGVSWWLQGVQGNSQAVAQVSKNAALSVHLEPVSRSAVGQFRLVTGDDLEIGAFYGSEVGAEYEVDPTGLQIGEGYIGLKYSVAGDTWDLGRTQTQVVTGITKMSFSVPVETEQGWISNVSICADGPTLLKGFKVLGSIDLFRGGNWQNMINRKPILNRDVTVTTEESSLSVNLGGLPLNRHIARVHFAVEVPSDVSYEVRGNEQLIVPTTLLLGADALLHQYPKGVLEIHPVALPVENNLFGNNWHFGWPVATMAGDTIVMVYQRTPAHWGSELVTDKYTSRAVVVRSQDGGRTWSDPVDVREFIKAPVRNCKAGFGNAIGTMSDGSVLLITTYGVFRSIDAGATWDHIPDAFGGMQLSGPVTNMGPRIIEHPEYGAIAFGHCEEKEGNIADEIWIRYSRDLGTTWHELSQILPSFVKAVEPAALQLDNRVVLLTRSHGSYDASDQTWRYVELVSTEYEPLLFEAHRTNIKAYDVRALSGNGGFGPWSQDTVDLSFNPITHRVEAVVTNRCGGGQGREHEHSHMTLNLWSIDPDDLFAGGSNWRFETTLWAKEGITPVNSDRGLHADGMHPGAAVIDEERGLQYVYVYLGFTEGPAGIFQITRTLDTEQLSCLPPWEGR
ncbi:MAG: glycoside hydrolase [Limnochordia bacterium]|nr:glycoside hydrolase [Limnochordia bacterium]